MDHGYCRTLELLAILEPLNDRLIFQTKYHNIDHSYSRALELLEILEPQKRSSDTPDIIYSRIF